MAGESAQREYERRRDDRRTRIRDNVPLLAVLTVSGVAVGAVAMQLLLGAWWVGALLGLLPVVNLLLPGQREVAWRKGAEGERFVGDALAALPATRALHDRRIPGSRANIDHILVAPTGVWTVDAKNYTGRLEARSGGQQLWINGRDRSKLLAQARRQTEVVERALRTAGITGVTVRPVLCFVGVEWPLLQGSLTFGDVAVVPPRRLAKLVDGEAGLSVREMLRVSSALESALAPAVDGASDAE